MFLARRPSVDPSQACDRWLLGSFKESWGSFNLFFKTLPSVLTLLSSLFLEAGWAPLQWSHSPSKKTAFETGFFTWPASCTGGEAFPPGCAESLLGAEGSPVRGSLSPLAFEGKTSPGGVFAGCVCS